MTHRQNKAVESLRRALIRCHASGLKGGVFDGKMCVWPDDTTPDPCESGRDFFRVVNEHGDILHDIPMNLDGGAGV